MTRWDLVYKWSDPKTQSLVDAVTSALENCDRKLHEAEARAASPSPAVAPLDKCALADAIHKVAWGHSLRVRHSEYQSCPCLNLAEKYTAAYAEASEQAASPGEGEPNA